MKLVQREDIFSYIAKQRSGFDQKLYVTLMGYASEFKDGDFSIGLATKDDACRAHVRALLLNTRLEDLHHHPIVDGELQRAIRSNVDQNIFNEIASLSLKQIKEKILIEDETSVKFLCQGLSSDAIATLVKLMSNDELISIGQKIYHPLPESQIGASGYLSARLQPNSPTDDPEDILMSVLSVWSYAEGDLMLGNNPASSNSETVLRTEMVLKDLVETFSLEHHLPWTVLAHIDIQSELELYHRGSTSLWFQSIAGTDAGLKTFDAPLKKLITHAAKRTERFGLYVEAGQGGDFTNGHGYGHVGKLQGRAFCFIKPGD
jgi:ethanolamine ammonia-lyase large subunit